MPTSSPRLSIYFVIVLLYLATSAKIPNLAFADDSSPKITRITPGTTVPGRTIQIRIEGTNLATVKSAVVTFLDTPSVVTLKPCKDEKTALCGNLSVPPDVPAKEYSISVSTDADGKSNVTETDMKLMVLPLLGSEVGYVPCPTSLGLTFAANSTTPPDNGLDQITCSQSLLGRNEASDIFGKRIANTYLVVQVDVRNLSDDYQFLLHDVRLVYSGQAVAGREKRLVRGVSEKGQALDVRNVVIRSVQGTGSILAGLSVFKFATIDFKNAVNVYQGPLAGALQSIFPDFTIGQLNRLNDLSFGVQSIVVPKKSSVALVTFVPQQVFLTEEDRKLLKTPWYDPRQPKGNMLKFQQGLHVEVAGAHVEEIQQSTPAVTTMYPTDVQSKKAVDFAFVGTSLDRVSQVRFGEAAKSQQKDEPDKTMTFTLTLPQHDPKFATASVKEITLSKGEYPVYLETALGKTIPTSLRLTVTDGNTPASGTSHDTPTIDSPKDQSLDKPQQNKSPVTKDVAFTGTHLDAIKSLVDTPDTACPDALGGVSFKIKNPPIPTSTTITVTTTVTDAAKPTKTVTWCVLYNDASKGQLPVTFEVRDSKK